jgi:EpsD family peptidyl-prolyl cis-trans isomerase
MSTLFTVRASALLASGLVALFLAGCGNKDDKKVATQVAAKVGSEEISVHQINQVLSRTNTAGVTPQAAQAMRKEVLEKLIDQQIAVDQATENKLNRSPEVVAQLEAARREVLARAYVQQLASALPKPTAEETKKYYADHPQLFSERRIFNLQEILVPASAGGAMLDQLRGPVAAGKPMEEIAALLKSKDVKFGGGSATRAAEQIPLELLAKVHALKDGQTALMENAQGYTVLKVVSSQSAPVNEASALPRIEQFLSNQRGAEAVTKNIKELRAKANIIYTGDFALAADTASTPVQTTAIPAPAAPPMASNAVQPPAAAGDAMSKGVSGLK